MDAPETKTYAELSTLCTNGPRPRYITGVIRWLLIEHFSLAGNIEQEQLKEYVWKQDPVESHIMIESLRKWNVETLEQRPALLVKRNSVQLVQLGINHGIGMSRDGSEDKSAAVQGSHTVFCIGQTSEEAEALGQEVFQDLLQFGPLIRQDCNLARWAIVELGAVAKLEESREHWVVPVVCGWAYFVSWKLRPLAPVLKSVSIKAGE